MAKQHIWLSVDDWSLYTDFLGIWRKNNRKPVSTDHCWEMGTSLSTLIILRRIGVVRRKRGDIWYWLPNPDVNAGVMIAGEDRNTQEDK